MEQNFKELNAKTGKFSKTAATALNKVKLAEAEIKKFAKSNPGHRNSTDSFSIPPDDDGSDDELNASSSSLGSTSSTSSSHQDSDAGDNPYVILGVVAIEDEALRPQIWIQKTAIPSGAIVMTLTAFPFHRMMTCWVQGRIFK